MAEISDRASTLVQRMNLEEKTAQLVSIWLRVGADGKLAVRDLHGFVAEESTGNVYSHLRNGIGQITRPLGTQMISAAEGVEALNTVQRFLIERTRLGIPALAHEECLAGVMAQGATLFPAGINLGALWDDQLVERIAAAIGDELVSIGSRQGLAPVLDVSRDARWGRMEETLGEDPYLAGCLATAYVRGLQGPDRRALATLKHFVGHSFSEGGRNHAPVHVGERELNDLFLLPFEMAVKLADAGSVMPAYHDIDGEPLTSSRHYLTKLLREAWGFDGLVVSDYEAISLLYEHHHTALDEAEAAAQSLKAGVDVELPSSTCLLEGVATALDRGLIEMVDIDEAVGRVLTVKERLGLFDHPFVDVAAICLDTEEHRATAREAAVQSITLLSNDGLLPLRRDVRTALLGPLADHPLAMLCGYSFPVHVGEDPTAKQRGGERTLRSALGQAMGAGNLLYSMGCKLLEESNGRTAVFPGDVEQTDEPAQLDLVSRDRSMIDAAVKTAAKAEQIVVAVGDLAGLFLSGTVGEGSDVSSLDLPGVQQELLDALLGLGKPLVVVLINGRPYNLHDAYRRANAVLEAWLPGQEGGKAIVDTLLGERQPGGRLPVSIPKNAGAMPYYYNHKLKSAGTPVQRDFGDIFPFGHGLNFTHFAYSDFAVASRTVETNGEIVISGLVRNTGELDGDEVVQVYVRDKLARLVRPQKELKAFKRLAIPRGRAALVKINLPADLLSYTIEGTRRIVEPGAIELLVGSSSAAIKYHETIELTGPTRTLPSNWRMQSTASYTLL